MSFSSFATRTLFCQLLKIHRTSRILMLSGILIIPLVSDTIKVIEGHTYAYRRSRRRRTDVVIQKLQKKTPRKTREFD